MTSREKINEWLFRVSFGCYPIFSLVVFFLGIFIFSATFTHQLCSWYYLVNKEDFTKKTLKITHNHISGSSNKGSVRRVNLFGEVDGVAVKQSSNAFELPTALKKRIWVDREVKIELDVLFAESRLGKHIVSGIDLAIIDVSYQTASFLKAGILSIFSNSILLFGFFWFLLDLKWWLVRPRRRDDTKR